MRLACSIKIVYGCSIVRPIHPLVLCPKVELRNLSMMTYRSDYLVQLLNVDSVYHFFVRDFVVVAADSAGFCLTRRCFSHIDDIMIALFKVIDSMISYVYMAGPASISYGRKRNGKGSHKL